MSGLFKAVAALLVLVIAAAAAFFVWLTADIEASVRDLAGLQGDPQRGAYLARLAGCVTCHTNTAGGGSFLAGGAAIVTDYGTFFAPNITSDVTHGIGAWTLQQFADAMADGRSPDGGYYYPVYPHRRYGALDDQDIVDLWAALKTVTPAQIEAPDHLLSFPVSLRRLIVPWRKIAGLIDSISASSEPPTTAARGKYIATGLGLCAGCHSSTNLFGTITAASFRGGSMHAGAPPLEAAYLESRGWTPVALAEALHSGRYPSGEPFESPMADVVHGSTAYLTAADRKAVADYLLSRGQAAAVASDEEDES